MYKSALSDDYILVINAKGKLCSFGDVDHEWLDGEIRDYSRGNVKMIRLNAFKRSLNADLPNVKLDSAEEELKMLLMSKEFIYDIRAHFTETHLLDATVDLTSSQLGKSTFSAIYKIERKESGDYAASSLRHKDFKSAGTLEQCILDIYENENSKGNPYEEYEYMYPREYRNFSLTRMFCMKGINSNVFGNLGYNPNPNSF
jgi:hypothetical protein